MVKEKKIIILCNDPHNSLEKIITEIKRRGNVGHTFEVGIDKEQPVKFQGGEISGVSIEWDGDGSDRIHSFSVEYL